jgi:hypothetical protein
MKTYEVSFLYTSGGNGKQRVQAMDPATARDYVKTLPGIKRVHSSLEVKDDYSYNSNKRSNSSSDDSSSSGLGVLILLILGVVAFANILKVPEFFLNSDSPATPSTPNLNINK